jgi:N-acetyl-anhydromuramyl-L-alanine amidase AmpD
MSATQRYETESWPFLPARDFLAAKDRTVRVIVIHTAETPETTKAAENVARYFQHPDSPSSAHICVDNDTIVQCVKDSNVAYAAPGVNNDGIQIELCCFMGQTKTAWLDRYSLALLAIGADATAQYCLKYSIPAVHLTDTMLAAGERGIIGHAQASRVYKKSDHQDPGETFPWSLFMAMVAQLVVLRR